MILSFQRPGLVTRLSNKKKYHCSLSLSFCLSLSLSLSRSRSRSRSLSRSPPPAPPHPPAQVLFKNRPMLYTDHTHDHT